MTNRYSAWALRPGVTYLNHGSFGPSPLPVIEAREEWARRLEAEPMDFFVRLLEDELERVADRLGTFVGAAGDDLLLAPNATVAMNLVAANVSLGPGDQVLTTNHEYGAVQRIWRETCRRTGAELVVQRLPKFLDEDQPIVDAVMAGATDRTRLIIASHVTSPTAVILPVEAICRAARNRKIPVCIDGPHAPAMVDVNIRALGCDYYCASLHKWVSAPFGSGFLYVARKRQQSFRPQIVSWGGSMAGRERSWKDEFTWHGTHDPSPLLAIPTALDFLDDGGLEQFREHARRLVSFARREITALTNLEPLHADSPSRQGTMISLPLPPLPDFEGGHGRTDPLQQWLWDERRIEIPIHHWGGGRYLRLSCHLYNTEEEIIRLRDAVALG